MDRPGTSLRRWPISLLALALCLIVTLVALSWPRSVAPSLSGVRIVWTFEPVERGGIVAGLAHEGDRLFVATVRDNGLSTSGAVCCLDRFSGKVLWQFDHDRR